MKYHFKCPVDGCNHVLAVDAQSKDEALDKLMMEGKAHAGKDHPDMKMSDEDMRTMISKDMHEGEMEMPHMHRQ